MGTQRLRNGAPHHDEPVHHTAVDFKVDRHAGRAQFVSVHHAFIDQWVTFGQSEPCRRHVLHLRCRQRRKTPVLAVCRCAQVVIEKIANVWFFEQEALGERLVRRRVLLRRAARINKKLQNEWQSAIARLQGAGGREGAARAVAAHCDAAGVEPPALTGAGDPLQRIPGVVKRSGKLVFGRESIVH